MTTATFMLIALAFTNSNAKQPLGDWDPQVYNAVKWTAPNQGETTIEFTTYEGISRIPIAYHGGVDTNASGEISENNITSFGNWTRDHLPPDYSGPVVLDYEQPWWKELRAKTIDSNRLAQILSVYNKGLRVAHELRPNAQWGYWGIPGLRHTTEKWTNQGLSLSLLVTRSSAVYPDIYDCDRGKDFTKRVEKHISTVLKNVAGKVPVYVFVSPRYCGEGGDRSLFIPDEIFLRQVNAALRAYWIDENGIQHRIKGVIFWDAYGYTPNTEWSELDKKHKRYFELLQALVKAWKKSMADKVVIVEPNNSGQSKYGLAEPKNSADVLDSGVNTQIQTKVPDNKIVGERVPSMRTKN